MLTWEQSLIGSVMLDPRLLPDDIRQDDFTVPEHKLIWKHVCELADRETLSERTLIESMREADELGQLKEGEAYIGLLKSMGDPTVIDEFIQQVKEGATKRELESFFRIKVIQSRNGLPSGEIIEDAISGLFRLQRSGVREAQRIGLDFDDRIKLAEAVRKGKIKPPWVPKVQAVKEVIWAADEADFILVVAETGSGKSSYIRYEAIGTSEDGEAVGTITLENTRKEAMDWALALHTNISHTKIKNEHLLSNAEFERIKKSKEWLEALPWYVEDMAFANLGAIRSVARKMVSKHNIRLLQVDGMYLVQPSKATGKYESISEVSQGLRSLAQELKIPIMATTQYNRGVKAKKEPGTEDILYAGENPARQIWAMTNKKMTSFEAGKFVENRSVDNNIIIDPKRQGAAIVNFSVIKNTSGPTGRTEDIVWRKATNSFQTLEKGWQNA